jgi:hypothetical protein
MPTSDAEVIPLSRQRKCAYCSCVVDTNARGVFQLAHGWLENRKSGGANTIALPLRRDIYSCHDCVDKLRHNIPWSQMPLFDPREYDDR